MWTVLQLIVDDICVYEREIWLTAAVGSQPRKNRKKVVMDAVDQIKRRYHGLLSTCDRYEIVLHAQSKLNIQQTSPLPM